MQTGLVLMGCFCSGEFGLNVWMNLEVHLVAFSPQRWSNQTHLGALCTIFTAFYRWSVKENPSNVKKKNKVPL